MNGLKYARLITRDVIRYRAHKLGFGTGELAFASEVYEAKVETSSHGRIVDWLEDAPSGGCSTWAARRVPSRAGSRRSDTTSRASTSPPPTG